MRLVSLIGVENQRTIVKACAVAQGIKTNKYCGIESRSNVGTDVNTL